jgi:alkylhydroperoxidase/carboxymuconolactone decarboxylase family protein YurZ
MTMRSIEDAFRRTTIGDPRLLAQMADPDAEACDLPRLDLRTGALVRIAALVALDAPASAYRIPVDAAESAGASREELLAVLVAVAGSVGTARVVSAAPRLALAFGYDVDAALEERHPATRDRPSVTATADRSEATGSGKTTPP